MPKIKQGDLGKVLDAAHSLLRSDPPLTTMTGTTLRRLVRKITPMFKEFHEAREETIKQYCVLEKGKDGVMKPKLQPDKRSVVFPDEEAQDMARRDIQAAADVDVDVPDDLVLHAGDFERLTRDKETGKVYPVDTVDSAALLDLGPLFDDEPEQEEPETPRKPSKAKAKG